MSLPNGTLVQKDSSKMEQKQYPKVGIGVMVFKNGKVLLGKRKGSHGAGEYAWPGGHLEFGESIIACGMREVKEETGIKIKNVKFLRLMNLTEYSKHYVDISLTAKWASGEPKILEPHKCERWDWYNLNDLPKPLFKTIKSSVMAYKSGKTFFDANA